MAAPTICPLTAHVARSAGGRFSAETRKCYTQMMRAYQAQVSGYSRPRIILQNCAIRAAFGRFPSSTILPPKRFEADTAASQSADALRVARK